MKFIHAADIHLDSPLIGLQRFEDAPLEEIRGATRRALARLVDLTIRERADFLLIAGDLYDGDWKDHNTGLFFIAQMRRLADAGVPVILIRGNHDAANKMTKELRLPENVTTLSADEPQTITLEDCGVAVHGRSFAQEAETANLAGKYPAGQPRLFNIGLLHTSLTGAIGHERYAPCTLDDLRAKNYQYWALGHVHVRDENVARDPQVVFPGNLQGRHIRETGPKGCMVVEADDRQRVSLRFEPLDVLRWEHLQVDCSGAATAYDALDVCEQHLAQLVAASEGMPTAARVTLHGQCAAHRQLLAGPEKWEMEIRGGAIREGDGRLWIEKVCFKTSPSGQREDWLDDQGPLSELLRTIRDFSREPAAMQSLAAQLEPLRKKLPADLVGDDEDALRLNDPTWLAEALAEVEPLLVARLSAQQEAP